MEKLNKSARVYVAGHRGLVGSALVRALRAQGYEHLLTRRHRELELTDQGAVEAFFAGEKPQAVLLAAARVGGIHANNTWRGEFIYQNLAIELNIIHAAWRHGVKRMIFLGSSCIYPRDCPQPMREEYLLSGPLESTNEPYAVAKIAGIKLCEAYNTQYGTRYIPVMPTNLYGPGDNFDLETSHVIPALIRKVHEAKQAHAPTVAIWGSGTPRREFLHVDDLAGACVFILETMDRPEMINVGYGEDVTIAELAGLICEVVGFTGALAFDPSHPDGTPRKLLDSGRIHALGWAARTDLRAGLVKTYEWFLKHGVSR